MLMLDKSKLGLFIRENRTMANRLLSENFVGTEVSALVKNLLAIAESTEHLLSEVESGTTDVRFLRRKLGLYKGIGDIVSDSVLSEIKMINKEAGFIRQRRSGDPMDLDCLSAEVIIQSSNRLKEQINRIAERMKVLRPTTDED